MKENDTRCLAAKRNKRRGRRGRAFSAMQLVARAVLPLVNGAWIRDAGDSRGSIVLVPRGSCSLVGYLGYQGEGEKEIGFSAGARQP